MSPAISRAAAFLSKRLSWVEDLPFAAAPHQTELSTSTTVRAQCRFRDLSSQRSHIKKASPSSTLTWAVCLDLTLSTCTNSCMLMSMLCACPNRLADWPNKKPPSSTTKSPCFSDTRATRLAKADVTWATLAPNPKLVLASVAEINGRKGLRRSTCQNMPNSMPVHNSNKASAGIRLTEQQLHVCIVDASHYQHRSAQRGHWQWSNCELQDQVSCFLQAIPKGPDCWCCEQSHCTRAYLQLPDEAG